jgi:4-hydroxybutyrate CoA-transferase
MDWREEYQRKSVSAEESVKLVKSGDRVEIASAPTLESALARRAGELEHVVIRGSSYRDDLPWFQPGRPSSFIVLSGMPLMGRSDASPSMKPRDHVPPYLGFLRTRLEEERAPGLGQIDIFMVTVSPPNEKGFCSFGSALLTKRSQARRAKVVLAEVSDHPTVDLRTGGENSIHVSEIDCFAPQIPASRPRVGRLRQKELTDVDRRIAQHTATLIRDGDTIELGVGSVAEALPLAGAFQGKNDLGLHTGTIWRGLLGLVKEGVFTGARKTLHREKVAASAIQLSDDTGEDLDMARFVDSNPAFELYDLDYIQDFKTIAAHNNFVAINSALAVDLSGQVTTESIDSRTVGAPGGFPAFAMGALMSRGGRSIIVMGSTAADGKVSRIVPSFPANTMVTLPRYFADYVVTEHGIASLMGKTQQERINALIGIAHPNFRGALEKELGVCSRTQGQHQCPRLLRLPLHSC